MTGEATTQTVQTNTDAATGEGTASTEGTTSETGTEGNDAIRTTGEAGGSTEGGEKTGGEGESGDAGTKAPENYDLKLPEDSLLDPSTIERISAEAREKGLSNEAAQELIDREHQAVSAYKEAQDEQVKEIQDSWVSTAEADKEIGGDAFKENVELAKRVVDRYGSDDFKKALNETGFGNHPEVLRIFTRIGKEMGEDRLVEPGSQTTGGKKNIEDVLYDKTAQQ